MSIYYRIKRLITSDAHALVEGLEEPRLVLAQAIRDMEAGLETLATRIHATRTELTRLCHKAEVTRVALTGIERDVEFAMAEKREDIAKHLIRRMLTGRRHLEGAGAKQAVLTTELAALEKEHAEKQATFESIRERGKGLDLTRESDDTFAAAEHLVATVPNLDHEVELEFLRRLKSTREVGHA